MNKLSLFIYSICKSLTTACAVITLCPVMAFCCFPLAEKSFYLSLMNFSLSFATSLASGSLFFLLFPSCLENREELEKESERLRHAGAIMCGMVWFFFILNRTSKMLFAKKLIDGQKRHQSVIESEKKDHRKSGSKKGSEICFVFFSLKSFYIFLFLKIEI